jgi:metal-responsive CopG/Arc/MetJ family transcriptional regulator
MARILSVSVPDELLAEAESIAATQGRTKSELVRDALRSHLKLQRLRTLQEDARERAEKRGIGPEDVEAIIDDVRKQRRS